MMASPDIKTKILQALRHPEAEEGLYFKNLIHVHEDEERPVVTGEEIEILDALKELIDSGEVMMDESGDEVVFMIASS